MRLSLERDTLPAVDPKALRNAFGHFPTGVCIVAATLPNGERIGVTVNSFTSVSLDPPLLLVCLARSLRSHDALVTSGGFAITVLHGEQAPVSTRFASSGADKWLDMEASEGAAGGLILNPHLAWFDCAAHAALPGGDHTILLGRVLRHGTVEQAAPLLYYRGGYAALAAGRTA
ncbi:flavin reductase [Roseococcus sp. SYP-B2431]|uniref:flavin reductase family protein n=1 Tax=Roseococcus sp. SYP-B2431 TaxID=2496640 RepID=UPI00103E8095|nr:flavin reductase family protein [Roseococcus sp. SYP-B2431]TCH96460.1 flavin reductase [Roseococcus sp. SYP-B2431]